LRLLDHVQAPVSPDLERAVQPASRPLPRPAIPARQTERQRAVLLLEQIAATRDAFEAARALEETSEVSL
jgi:hypothetical protein